MSENPHNNPPWQDKAHVEITRLCRQSYLDANQLANGRMRRKYRPYHVPQLATDLVECLNRNDEHAAKVIFVKMACVPNWENDPDNR